MRKLLALIFLLFSCSIWSQRGIYINDSSILFTMKKNTMVYVDGDFQYLNSSIGFQAINGEIQVAKDFVVNKNINFERAVTNEKGARLTFVGGTDSRLVQLNQESFSDSALVYLNQLVINKTNGANVYIDNNIKVRDTIFFHGGNAILGSLARVFLDLSLGTNSVRNNPYIIGENAQHRFTGDGFLYAKYLKSDSLPDDQFNTGLYLNVNQSNTIEFYRGHTKQLYAGNGSIDRFFDLYIQDTIDGVNGFARIDSVSIKYLADLDYASMGVDATQLGVFVSKQFQDNDYIKLQRFFSNRVDSVSITDLSSFTHPIVHVPSMKFRITLADTICSEYPISNLPTDIQNLCDIDSLNVLAYHPINSVFSYGCFWEDSSFLVNRTFYPSLSAQSYGVEIYDNRGCSIKDTLYINPVAPNPSVSFSYEAVCLGDTVILNNGSIISAGYTSNWIMGDGYTLSSNDVVVKHLYTDPGNYEVKLEVTSDLGCTSEMIRDLTVFNNPIAVIDYDYDCALRRFSFDGIRSVPTTIPQPNDIVSRTWAILPDVQGVVTQQNYFLENLNPGIYRIQLNVETGYNCKDSVQEVITVYPTNTASIVIHNGCVNSPLTIENHSIVNTINARYVWRFSDGTVYNDVVPNKQFDTAGLYTVVVYIYSDAQCVDSSSVHFSVFANPSSEFILQNTCEMLEVSYVPLDLDMNNNYRWSFGDGTFINQLNANHRYLTAGNYVVSLEVTNINGCTSQTSKSLVVYSKPLANFTQDEVCLGTSTQFTNRSVGSHLNYSWLFDQNVTSNLLNPTYSFANTGVFPVQLVVVDNNHCRDTLLSSVIVKALPTFQNTNIQTCGTEYTIDATDATDVNASFRWLPSNSTLSTYTFNQSGSYSLVITSGNNCSRTFPITVVLNSTLSPNLGDDLSVVCESILLDPNVQGDHLWNTGVTTSTLNVNSPGIYWVTVTDQNGCIGSDTITISSIVSNPVLNLGTDLSICESELPFNLNAGNHSTYLWQNGSTNSFFTVEQSGYYSVKVFDENGCWDTDTINVVIHTSPRISPLQASVQACASYTLAIGGSTTYHYQWSDGFSSAIRTFYESGLYFVVVSNPATGCLLIDSIDVTISEVPTIELGPDLVVCSNTPVIFDFSGINGSFQWISTSQAVVGTSPIFSPTSSDLYVVNVTSPEGCTFRDAVNVQFLPAPVIPNHMPVYYICGETPVQLEGSLFGVNNWTATNGFSGVGNTIDVHEIGTYYLTANVNNCLARDSFILITSPQQIEAFYMVDTDTTKNLLIQFIDLSDPSPISYLWDFGDGTTDTSANPSHIYLQAATYQTSLTVSNGFCQSTFFKEILQKTFSVFEDTELVYSLDLENFILFPNPSHSLVNVNIVLNDRASVRLVLLNNLGQVLQENLFEQIKELEFIYDLSDVSAGSYHVYMEAESLKGKISKNIKLNKLN